ncbi:hypothetical protein A3709_04735 [Halioglobus sp. HI00S01]|uniref:DUF4760 domain-containing protein n=1 Tax=Halioglobus sp. HI00S01 TaxID=1822214 RepID=UPI0007C26C21|nr:hypothetical protein [Halioglobus sp. HI00S01]KZX57075.1 hypothetical protein A3709_04735 [Halioglobus sp. HI00S01]
MTGIPLSTWAVIAEIIGASSILTGLIVGLFQIRQFRIQQRDAVAINLAQTFYSPDLPRAIGLLQPLPDGISLNELRARGPEYEHATITVCTSFETIGLLVHQGIAPMQLLLDLAGGIVSTMSRKLEQWQEDFREEQQQPSWGEWFELLGNEAAQHKHVDSPAHIRYAGSAS